MKITTAIALVCLTALTCSCQPRSPASTSPVVTPEPMPADTQTPSATKEPESNLATQVLRDCTPQTNGDSCVLSISGEITPGVSAELSRVASSINSSGGKIAALTISSIGGDLKEALKIGRFARSSELNVVVPEGSTCYSSCVLVLAGGVTRHPFGTVGIHRPYFADGAESTDQARDSYSALREEVITYLHEGGISTKLWDDMMLVSAENIKVVSFPELEAYGLLGRDPSYEESEARKEMKRYGIDRIELNRRKTVGKQICDRSFPENQIDRVTCQLDYLRDGNR